MNIYVANINFRAQEEQLKELFQQYGEVASVKIVTDRETGRSRGFAFIEMDNDEEAKKSIEALNNKMINGRPMKVCEDRGKTNQAGGSSDNAKSEGGGRKHEILTSIQRMQLFKRRKKLDPFMQDPTKTVDYKDVSVLGRFVSERGRILSRRLTGLSAYNQRKVSKAIKRAQHMGLMPFSNV